ncbi:unnamed protein product [Psylliodes chrysocephalus]|uniref:Uncharacterized protein n=1 Tax=Psylliodes chrysocephalus TaxID=3402493 RepID=A0A9P0GE62_9CUCU|nr:unnamed protein product [Psylliodes chrysocephala]
MNYASSISKNHLKKYCSNFVDNQSSGCDDSLLSLDFCSKVLGKPCFNYKNTAKKSDKRFLVDIKKEVTVYTLIEETANPFVTDRESKDSTASKTATKPIAEGSANYCEKPSMSTQFDEASVSPGFKQASMNTVLMDKDRTEIKDSEDNIEFAKLQSIGDTREIKTKLNNVKAEEILSEINNKRGSKESTTKERNTQTAGRRHRTEENQNIHTGYHQPRPLYYRNEESQTTHPSILTELDSQSKDWYPVKDVPLGLADKAVQSSEFKSYPVKDTSLGSAEKAVQSSDDGKNKRRNDVITRGNNTVNTDSFNVQVTELVSSKMQTSNTESMDAEICCAPFKDAWKYNHLSPRKLPSKYIENVYPKSEKYKQEDVYEETVREPCCCCCYCCCQSVRNNRHCSCEDCYEEPQYHGESNHRCKISSCVTQCRKCFCADNRPQKPPAVPTYDASTSSDYDEDDDIELIVDRLEDSDGYSSENSVVDQRGLPHQNSEEYEDLVQELEESLQIRSRNRVKRALLEFERKSSCNKPLEKPIINYEEASESEEPLIRKISELREKRKKIHKSFPCRGKACCTYRLKNDKEQNINQVASSKFQACVSRLSSIKNDKPVKCQSVQTSRKPRLATTWRQDKETGEWYKINAPLSNIPNLLPCQKTPHFCNCAFSCCRY